MCGKCDWQRLLIQIDETRTIDSKEGLEYLKEIQARVEKDRHVTDGQRTAIEGIIQRREKGF